MAKGGLFSAQFRAVFLKNLSLEFRQTKLLVFQILPVIVVLVIVGLLTLLRVDPPDLVATRVNVPTPASVGTQPFLSYRDEFKWSPYTFADSTGLAGGLFPNGTRTPGFLATIPSFNFTRGWRDQGEQLDIAVPFFTKFDTFGEVNANLTTNFGLTRAAKRSPYSDFNCEYSIRPNLTAFSTTCEYVMRNPIAGFSFTKASLKPQDVSFAYKIEALKMGFESSFYGSYSTTSEYYVDSPVYSPFSAITFMNSVFMRWMTNTTSSTNFSAYSITGAVAPVTLEEVSTMTRGNIFGQFVLFAIAFSLVMPFFMFRIVIERGSGLMEVSRMAGLSVPSYWASLFITDYVHYLGITIFMVAVGLAFKFQLFFQSTIVLLPVLFLGGFPVITISYFFAVMFKTVNGAFLFAYLLGIAQALGGSLLNIFVFDAGVVAPGWFSFYPPFALFRAIFVIAHSVAEPERVRMSLAEQTAGIEIAWMMGFSVVFFILALYVDQILPRSEGMKRPFYFPITDVLKLCGCIRSKEVFAADEDPHHEFDAEIGEEVDSDVSDEKRRVMSKNFGSTEPVVIIDGLTKYYTSMGAKPFKAVKGVWLHINDGECFGLLGPNGAGKTTLVNMLVGLLLPTSGRAKIGGRAIAQNVFRAQDVIGLCPQFDILYDDLTVEEHLLFHVRLKGYPRESELDHVQSIIDEVGLQTERRRLASALSGGQKRRLSIGIALAGNPMFVLLDEPTSGLDPGSKRAVWDVIRQARAKRCFLLTTHSMEEAEVLCTRIGIMAGGELKCLGTQQHLKSKYGEGFKIDVMYESGERDKADAFITSTIPEAKLAMSNEGFLSYQAPRSIKLSQVFTKIESQKRRHGIISWGLSQANLEQVFLAIVKHAEASTGDQPADATQPAQ